MRDSELGLYLYADNDTYLPEVALAIVPDETVDDGLNFAHRPIEE